MTTKTQIPSTCPTWCTRDHSAAQRRLRALNDEAIRRGWHAPGDPELNQGLAEFADEERNSHSTAFGERVTVDQLPGEDQPVIGVLGSDSDCMTALEARTLAGELLAAADKLDEITSGVAA